MRLSLLFTHIVGEVPSSKLCSTLQTSTIPDEGQGEGQDDWLLEWMGRAPMKSEQQQEEEDDEDVTIVNVTTVTPPQPLPSARKRSQGAEGPPG